MNKTACFFYCAFRVHLPGSGIALDDLRIRTFCELVEIGKDDTVPAAFHKWITDHHDALVAKYTGRYNAEPLILNTYALAP